MLELFIFKYNSYNIIYGIILVILIFNLLNNNQLSIKKDTDKDLILFIELYLKKKNIILNLRDKKYLLYFLNKKYKVNDINNSQNATNIIAHIMCIIYILISRIVYDKNINNIVESFLSNYNHIISNKQFIKFIKVIYNKLPYIVLKEAPIINNYTSYNINKGEEINLCIRDKKTLEIQNLNEILYVAIHEVSHIGCPDIGHTNIFFLINNFLLKRAICMNLYNYIDYNKYNKNYCGIVLKSNILKDNEIFC